MSSQPTKLNPLLFPGPLSPCPAPDSWTSRSDALVKPEIYRGCHLIEELHVYFIRRQLCAVVYHPNRPVMNTAMRRPFSPGLLPASLTTRENISSVSRLCEHTRALMVKRLR